MISQPFAPPSLSQWLGSDALGQSFLRILLVGSGLTVADVVLAATIALFIGFMVAMCGSVMRGWAARFFFTLASTFSFSTPLLAVLLLLYSLVGDHSAVFPIAAGGLLWGSSALTLQTALARERRSTYLKEARALGFGSSQILLGHLLPNLIPHFRAAWAANLPVVLSTNILVAYLGAHGSNPRLGSLLKSGYELFPACWWLWLPVTVMTCVAFAVLFSLSSKKSPRGLAA